MLIVLIPIVTLLLAIAFMRVGYRLRNGKVGTKFERWCSGNEGTWNFTTVASTGVLVIMLACFVIYHVKYAPFPSEYRSVKSTLTLSRVGSTMAIERAAVIHKVIDMNKELATVKYWNESVWVGWYWPDRVAKLEYIQ